MMIDTIRIDRNRTLNYKIPPFLSICVTPLLMICI